MPAERYYRMLQENDVALILARLGRAVTWRQDRLAIRALGIVGAEEREQIRERTHGALERRFVNEGRGWPGSRRFGFRRNPITKYLDVDPAQWPFVKAIHFGFANLEDGSGKGVRRLAMSLADRGCGLSVAQIRKILRDPIYVTGLWSITYRGEVKPGRRIQASSRSNSSRPCMVRPRLTIWLVARRIRSGGQALRDRAQQLAPCPCGQDLLCDLRSSDVRRLPEGLQVLPLSVRRSSRDGSRRGSGPS